MATPLPPITPHCYYCKSQLTNEKCGSCEAHSNFEKDVQEEK